MPTMHNNFGRQIVRDLTLLLIGGTLILKFMFGATLNNMLAHLAGWFH